MSKSNYLMTSLTSFTSVRSTVFFSENFTISEMLWKFYERTIKDYAPPLFSRLSEVLTEWQILIHGLTGYSPA